MKNYISMSLEMHLFFSRIMKEDSLFMEAGFLPFNAMYIKQADTYKNEFEELLLEMLKISEGVISKGVIESGELITEYTPSAERETSRLTGIEINDQITLKEQKLMPKGEMKYPSNKMRILVKEINQKSLRLLNALLAFEEEILNRVRSCGMFISNPALFIQHAIREAKLYRSYIVELERRGSLDYLNIRNVQMFWDRSMMEHTMFIRSQLDPSEEKLIELTHKFVKEYKKLLEEYRSMNNRSMNAAVEKARKAATGLREFMLIGVRGVTSCEIQSVMLPLLFDHMLRKTNYYLRILNE